MGQQKIFFPFQAKTNQNLSKFLTKALYASEQLTVSRAGKSAGMKESPNQILLCFWDKEAKENVGVFESVALQLLHLKLNY